MYNFFLSDNKFVVFLRQLADVVLLNLIFLLFCAPVFTIGAALSSLYSVLFQEVEGREPKLWVSFWKAFKENFKPSLVLWIPMAFIGLLLWFDAQLMQGASGGLAPFFSVLVLLGELLYGLEFSYLFPMLAKFENTPAEYYAKALLYSMKNLPFSLLMVLVNALPLLLLMLVPDSLVLVLFLMFTLGFSTQALTNTIILRRVFRDELPEPEVLMTEEEEAEEAGA